MNKELFDRIAEQSEAIEKQAFLAALGGALLRGAGRLGGMLVRNPGKALTGAVAASDISGGAKKFTDMANTNPSNPFTR